MDVKTNPDTKRFKSLIQGVNLVQHVNEPTYVAGHTLDLVLSRPTDPLVQDITVKDPGISVHFAVIATLLLRKPSPIRLPITVPNK